MKKSERRSLLSGFSGLVPLFIVAHFAYHLIGFLLSPLMPSIRKEFALDYTKAGFMLSAVSLTSGIANLPAGWLADHIRRRLLITITICGVALAGLLISFAQTYIMMVVFLVLLGAVGGGYHVSAPPLIAASVEPKKQGSALGLHMIGGSSCHFLAPLIAVGIAAVWGWRSPYISLSIPVFIFGIIFYILLGRRVADEKKSERTTTGERKTERKVSSIQSDAVPSRMHWGPLISFLTLSVLCGAVSYTPIAFLPLFLVDKFGASQEMAGVFLSIVSAGALMAAPLGGYLSDRLGPVPVILTMFSLAAPLIYLLNLVPYGVALGAVLVAIGAISSTRMPVSESFVISHTPERYRSTVLGIYYFGGSEIGGALTPVMGNLIDRFGFYTAFNIGAAATLIITLVCAIWLWRRHD